MTTSLNSETGPRLVQLDPATLIVGANVRVDTRVDAELIGSIRAVGVLQPIVAYADADGQHVVLYGQRRTLAAVEAARATVPVMLVARPDEPARVIEQLAENRNRVGLTLAEDVAAVEQLEAFGLSAKEIAKRTARPRNEVDAALIIAKAPTALEATTREELALTLDQAAGLAEFEDDEEATLSLIAAAEEGPWDFEHELSRQRHARQESQREQEARAALEAQGLRVVDKPRYDDTATKSIYHLTDSEGAELTVASHEGCPGHVVYVALEWVDGEQRYGGRAACENWAEHGHQAKNYGTTSAQRPRAEDMTEEQREEAKNERAEVIRCNKEWTSAETVRREWLTGFVARKTAPKGAAAFVAILLTEHSRVMEGYRADSQARETFAISPAAGYGTSHPLADQARKAAPGRALMLALGVALAACEGHLNRDMWRREDRTARFYLRALTEWGYGLSEVEQRAAGLPD